MADTYTTNYNLTKAEIGASRDAWGGKINANFDTIDATMKAVSNVANAAMPKAGGAFTGGVTGTTLTLSGAATFNGAVTVNNTLTAATDATIGGASIVRSTAGTDRSGYFSFLRPGGARAGYVGWASADTIGIIADVGWHYDFNEQPTVDGYDIWHEGNLTPGDYMPKTGGTFTGSPTIANTSPRVNFSETDQTLPAGVWRTILSSNNFYIQRNTAAAGDYSTAATPFYIAGANDIATFSVTPKVVADDIWHEGNDGAGSTLDADLLDGQHGAYYRDLANSTGEVPNGGLSDGAYTGILSAGFSSVIGEKISLYGAIGVATSYALGIESGTLYYRSNGNHRWYVSTVADAGVSDVMNLSASGLQVENLIITSTTDVDLASTGNAIQIGLSTAANLVADANEIQARSNGAAATLALNSAGGAVSVNGNTVWHAGNLDPTDYMPKTGGAFTGGIFGTTLSLSSTLGVSGAVTFGGATRPKYGTSTIWDAGNFDPTDYMPKTGGTFTGSLTVDGNVSALAETGNGGVSLLRGGASNTGYCSFLNPDGTRAGYVGFADATDIKLTCDGGRYYNFNTVPRIAASPIYYSGNIDPYDNGRLPYAGERTGAGLAGAGFQEPYNGAPVTGYTVNASNGITNIRHRHIQLQTKSGTWVTLTTSA